MGQGRGEPARGFPATGSRWAARGGRGALGCPEGADGKRLVGARLQWVLQDGGIRDQKAEGGPVPLAPRPGREALPRRDPRPGGQPRGAVHGQACGRPFHGRGPSGGQRGAEGRSLRFPGVMT